MKQKKIITVIGIISLLIFGGIIANIFIMNTKQNLSETNTTEFLGTVKNVATTGTGGDEYGVLCTMEYEAKLYIYHINDFIDTSEFINLQQGQLIYFRIENAWLDTFDEINFVNIVSLRTNEKDLISLNNYIKFMDKQQRNAIVISIVTAILFLLIFIYCMLCLKGFWIFRFK